ncbi:MAG: hypothetical protein JSS96_13170 [Bacteroidetes bacterium]|nr:hypothetical protein [Bacteroidota bacterium]
MITSEQIEVYKKYKGDGDVFIRCATEEEKTTIDYINWSLIDRFVQDIRIVKRKLAPISFKNSLNKQLEENCDTNKTIKQLEGLA